MITVAVDVPGSDTDVIRILCDDANELRQVVEVIVELKGLVPSNGKYTTKAGSPGKLKKGMSPKTKVAHGNRMRAYHNSVRRLAKKLNISIPEARVKMRETKAARAAK